MLTIGWPTSVNKVVAGEHRFAVFDPGTLSFRLQGQPLSRLVALGRFCCVSSAIECIHTHTTVLRGD